MLQMSMYMRGWNGRSEYPLQGVRVGTTQASTNFINITQAIASFENSPAYEFFRHLPLFGYSGTCFLKNVIYNVGTRLNLVKVGEASENVDGCVRLSSNYFATTAWRIYQLLRLPQPFDINKLPYIS